MFNLRLTRAICAIALLATLTSACTPILPAVPPVQSTAAESAAAETIANNTDSTAQTGEVAAAIVEETAVEEVADVEVVSAEGQPAKAELPAVVAGKFNVVFLLPGPIGDGGWGYAHNEGRLLVEKYLGDKVHTAIVENVPEGPVSEGIIRSLAQAGFDAIFACSFGYMDPTATVAAEFPDKYFVHVSGHKKNETNFANMFGSMESMKYLAGMIAGARALEDGSKRVGYVAPFPFAEVTRYINASALGMRRTCPDCIMDVRWTFSWFDPEGERQAAREMLDAGATVIMTGADTTGPVEEAAARGLWGIGYDSDNACDVAPDHCLTTTYWDWGQVNIWLINKMLSGKFVGQDYYFDTDSAGLGLTGFMQGQTPAPGVPASIATEVQSLLNQMLNGQITRFDLFTGPINDNTGAMIVPPGVTLSQSDLEGLQNIEGRKNCTICMNWLAEGVDSATQLPSMN